MDDHQEEHYRQAQDLVEGLSYNLSEWIGLHDKEAEIDTKFKATHDQCRKCFVVIHKVLQDLILLLEKDNCA